MNKEAEKRNEKETKKSYMKEMYKNCNGRAAEKSLFVFRVINSVQGSVLGIVQESNYCKKIFLKMYVKLRNRERKDKCHDVSIKIILI